ncbi:type I restriction and modification system, specificity subunit S, partial [Lacticaseibacillus paracasei subsp. paracasei CNCM I-4648]
DKIDILEQISLALKRHLYNHSWCFKDEDEPWIIQTLNNSTSKIKSYSLIRSVETLTNTGYKYIHYGDIHTGKVTLINSVGTLPNIPAGNYELLSKGDLILADASEDYKGIADAAIILDTDDQRVVAGLHTIALRPQNTDPVFLYYLFQTEKFKTFARKMGTGLKVFGISYSNLVRFKFASPSKLREQQRIGNLLLTIENLLRVTTTSLKALRSVKQSLLQNLFM